MTQARTHGMKWLKLGLIALALLLVVAAVLPFFISLNDYLPPIERKLSAELNEPVAIKSISLSVLPVPHVTVDGITIGKANDIKLGTVVVTPDLFSLLQTDKVIRDIDINGLTLTQRGLEQIQAWATAEPASSQPSASVRINNIRLNNARVNFDSTTFGPFDARAALTHTGELATAAVGTQNGKLTASLTREQANYRIEAHAKAWTLPLEPALLFDELSIKGMIKPEEADLSQINARLYGGSASGKVVVRWPREWQLTGNFAIDQVEVRTLAALVVPGTRVSGRLTAKPVFSATAPEAAQLPERLRLETPFSVQNGVLYGVDIEKAATNLIKQGATGGETRFDQLAGHLVMAHGAYQFTQLKIVSGAMAVDGDVDISPQNKLSGRINAQLKALGSGTKIPLNVAGTVDSPLLYPTKGTMAGAAVGTTLMGPGLGTSVGAKVGGWIEGIFGKKKDTKPKQ